MSTSEAASEQARRAAVGAVRTHRLRPAVRLALGRLLLDFFAGLDEAAFWKRWKALDLAAADGLTHLALLADSYYRQLARSQVARVPPEVGELLVLIAIYLGELEGRERFGPADLPIPVSSLHPNPDQLPIPEKEP